MKRFICALAPALVASFAHADVFQPISYDMLNGQGQAAGGIFNYWDRSYNGSGSTTTDLSSLSGGVGELTDGYVATDRWYNIENNQGTGPYVGWRTVDPLIHFNFASSVHVDSIAIWIDNSHVGGVLAPASVTINGVNHAVNDPGPSAPYALVFSGLNLDAQTIDVQLQNQSWVFVSEVQFQGTPEPATMAALAVGAAGLIRRKRSR